jgi:hypothetical protein
MAQDTSSSDDNSPSLVRHLSTLTEPSFLAAMRQRINLAVRQASDILNWLIQTRTFFPGRQRILEAARGVSYTLNSVHQNGLQRLVEVVEDYVRECDYHCLSLGHSCSNCHDDTTLCWSSGYIYSKNSNLHSRWTAQLELDWFYICPTCVLEEWPVQGDDSTTGSDSGAAVDFSQWGRGVLLQ